MKPLEIIAQVIGIVAMAFNILSFQRKTRTGTIVFQLIGSALFCVNYCMLGALVGGILNAVAVVRALIFVNKEKLKADNNIWLAVFTLVYLASYVLNFTVFGKEPTAFNFVIEILPVVAMFASTLGYRYTDAKSIRRFALISSPSWLIYAIANGSVGAIFGDALGLCSVIIGILRFDLKKIRK